MLRRNKTTNLEVTLNAEPLRRAGRPDQQASEELARHIIATAARLFIDQGYAATSLEQVAAAAGCGKQTLYRRFASKEGLFTEVINSQGHKLLVIAEAAETTCSDPIEALNESCRLLFDFALQPDMVRLHRILVAEVGRFPNLGEFVLESCMGPFNALLKRQLQASVDAGRFQTVDLELTHALMTSVMTGWPIQHALLGRAPFETPQARDAYFEAAWSLFIRGAA